MLTFIVLAVILFGITTASESAGIGALGALYLACVSKYSRRALWSSLVGAIIGVAPAVSSGLSPLDPAALVTPEMLAPVPVPAMAMA
jgi:hypothetical protein